MVRLFDEKHFDKIADLVYRIFHAQEPYTHIVEVNCPRVSPCIYAMWHGNQMAVYGVRDKYKTNVLISRSKDGEIVARALVKMGFKVIRGSKGKQGAVEASMQMISALKAGEDCAMMIDGPKGPPKVAKNGVIKIARMSGAPIVPLTWYSINPTLVTFPSWDKLRMPLWHTNIVNLYGEPIYVKEDDDNEEVRKRLQQKFDELDAKIPEAYKEVFKWGIWRRKRSESSQFKWNP